MAGESRDPAFSRTLTIQNLALGLQLSSLLFAVEAKRGLKQSISLGDARMRLRSKVIFARNLASSLKENIRLCFIFGSELGLVSHRRWRGKWAMGVLSTEENIVCRRQADRIAMNL
jgi:hypothetical protein